MADLTDFTLRRAAAVDAGAIRRLVYAARINPVALSWQRFWVAQDAAGKVAGCLQVKPHSDGTRELASLVVAPRARGLGLARALIEQLLAEHAPPLYLTCAERLGPLYEKFGFRTLSPSDYPPYFRRITRLYSLFRWLIPRSGALLVMKEE